MRDQRAQPDGDFADRAGELLVLGVLGPAVPPHAEDRATTTSARRRGDGEDEPRRGRGEQEAGDERGEQ